MNKSLRITTQSELIKFINDVDGLHDAILHEVIILLPGHVNQKGEMYGDSDLPNAQMIFQSQFSDVLAVRIDFKRVSRFRFEPNREFKLEGEITNGEIILYLSGKPLSMLSEIRAAEITYTMLGKEFLGAEYKLIRNEP